MPALFSGDFHFFTRNTWDANYWDDWIGLKSPLFKMMPRYIPLGFNFDWHPASEPYDISGGDLY